MKHESYCETRESLVILSRTLDHSYFELKILKDFENDEFSCSPACERGSNRERSNYQDADDEA